MGPLSTRVGELAVGYLGDIEVGNNDGPWLRDLFAKAGNQNHWIPGESYCIASLCALFDIARKEQNGILPFPMSLSTRGFYEEAKRLGFTKNGPEPLQTYEPGDIAIFSDGTSWRGHAAFVTGVDAEGLDTIEFNTSGTNKGDQRNGGGCFRKRRLFRDFAAMSATHLWLRGSVKTSRF